MELYLKAFKFCNTDVNVIIFMNFLSLIICSQNLFYYVKRNEMTLERDLLYTCENEAQIKCL